MRSRAESLTRAARGLVALLALLALPLRGAAGCLMPVEAPSAAERATSSNEGHDHGAPRSAPADETPHEGLACPDLAGCAAVAAVSASITVAVAVGAHADRFDVASILLAAPNLSLEPPPPRV